MKTFKMMTTGMIGGHNDDLSITINSILSADRPASCGKNLLAALRGDNSHFVEHRHLICARTNS